jgi:hypothetical protein
MYADEWPEVVNMVQSVLNNSLSTKLNKRKPMQVFTGHVGDYTACADIEGQRACQSASGLYQSAESYGGLEAVKGYDRDSRTGGGESYA